MMNPDLIQELPKLNYCEQGNKIFVKPGVYPLSSRKLEGFMKIANLQKYYQCNPVRFINDFFNIELLDAQAWVIQRAWNCPNVLLVCTRGFGKSTLIDIMIMAKDMLFNNYWTYIASGSGSQAEQTFTTLERLANDNIDTMLGSTGYIFKAEIEIKNAAGDGFSHSSNGFSYSLYNGSFTQTLNSNVDKKRGMRGSVVFDECGFLDEEMMSVYAAFAIVNKSFREAAERMKDCDMSDVSKFHEVNQKMIAKIQKETADIKLQKISEKDIVEPDSVVDEENSEEIETRKPVRTRKRK